MDIRTEGETARKTCIVVNEQDEMLHIGGLAQCHERPMTLHRAFSLFVFDEAGKLLLQQRAKTKYTFPLAWTNTVCSHPRTNEKPMEEWIDIRIQDELGWSIKDIRNRLVPFGKLTYEAYSDFKYGEKEIDTLYFLQIKEEEKKDLDFNRDEVDAIDWVEPARLSKMMCDDRFLMTPWFKAIAAGIGHPFYDSIQKTIKQAKNDEQPQESKDGQNQEVTVIGNNTLPWLKVGNCSMPQANKSSDLLLQMPFSFLCSNPGKSIRSQLVKLYGDVDTDLTPKDIEGIAWIIERIHAASLLHDDIEDKSTTRRGAVCAHLIWGTAQTINTGTFNFLRSIQGVDEVMEHHDLETRSKIMRTVVDTLINLHRGQNADIVWGEQSLCPTIDNYVEMIDHKSGALFKLCAQLGSLCTNKPELGAELGDQFIEFGRYFQIRDDYCNICDPVYWKGKGFYEDADEGKFSYPVLVFLENNNDTPDGKWLLKKLSDRSAPMNLEEKLRAYTILYESKALEQTKDLLNFKLKGLNDTIGKTSERAQQILKLMYIVDIINPSQVQDQL